MVLEAGKSEIKVPTDLVYGSWMAVFSMCPHMAEGLRELSEVSFIRALITFMSTLPSQPTHFPKTPNPNATTLRIKFPHMNFEVTQTSSL